MEGLVISEKNYARGVTVYGKRAMSRAFLIAHESFF